MADLNFISFYLSLLPECLAGQVAPPECQRADTGHLRLVRALMGQQGFVVGVVRVQDDQALADGEASSEEQQAGGDDHVNVSVPLLETITQS